MNGLEYLATIAEPVSIFKEDLDFFNREGKSILIEYSVEQVKSVYNSLIKMDSFINEEFEKGTIDKEGKEMFDEIIEMFVNMFYNAFVDNKVFKSNEAENVLVSYGFVKFSFLMPGCPLKRFLKK